MDEWVERDLKFCIITKKKKQTNSFIWLGQESLPERLLRKGFLTWHLEWGWLLQGKKPRTGPSVRGIKEHSACWAVWSYLSGYRAAPSTRWGKQLHNREHSCLAELFLFHPTSKTTHRKLVSSYMTWSDPCSQKTGGWELKTGRNHSSAKPVLDSRDAAGNHNLKDLTF